MTRYKAGVSHKNRVQRVQDRLAGLEALYETYEQVGWNPADNRAMKDLKQRIYSTKAQLRVMGTDVAPPSEVRSKKGDRLAA